MRLLRFEANGVVSLVEHFGEGIPCYAILSHTWGEETDEVTFKDLTLADGAAKDKRGYEKIRFCGKQARKDCINHFWIDTCCIDRSSSAEVSEAINSMFRWYQHAAKCYVYLSDVSTGDNDPPISHTVDNDPYTEAAWKQAFRCSRWFTRSWTLQELIAPAAVEFFSAESEILGDKKRLSQEIYSITKIPIRVLSLEKSPSEYSIGERLEWAKDREAKREEDIAYSLLGLFDIHMPLIYGEGRRKAFGRLCREIEQSRMDDQLAQQWMPSTNRAKWTSEASSAPSTSTGSSSNEHSNSSTESRERRAAPGNYTTIGDSAGSSSIHSLGPTYHIENRRGLSFNAFGNASQFNTRNGTQNNNTGSGVQLFGSLNGLVIFGSAKRDYSP